jgi:hypothetical protein
MDATEAAPTPAKPTTVNVLTDDQLARLAASTAPQSITHNATASGVIVVLWAATLVHLDMPSYVAVAISALAGTAIQELIQRRGK